MKINYEGIDYDISDKYSFKDFTGWDLSDRKDMDNLVIYGSCFSNENPDSLVLPKNLKNTIFIVCNLDNVFIPDGNNVLGGSNYRFKVQNDLRDWIIDINDQPIKVTNEKFWENQMVSVDPDDIPLYKIDDIEQMKILLAVNVDGVLISSLPIKEVV
jgi:hypothetical protein